MNGFKAPRPQWVSALVCNWVGIFGVVLAMCSLFAALCLIAIDFLHGFRQPYVGILIYLILPSFFWIGLIFAAVGVWLERRRLKKPAAAEACLEVSGGRRTRQLVVALAGTFLFLMLSSLGSYRAFQVTESPGFCGALCHTVMQPEYVTYKSSPHSRVRCTECHIGPGASWFVRSKISGLYQVYATVTNTYPRPIPVPVQNLRPAPETCEQCHWPAKFYGWMELRRQFFLPDEHNTPWNIRLLVYVGGAIATKGPVGGIHWHMNVSNRMEYIATDESRQTIPWVKVTNRETGAVTVYQSRDNPLTPQQKTLPVRVLDCVDCHNRPTHIFDSPYSALDVAMWLGRIDPSIPSIKLKASRGSGQGRRERFPGQWDYPDCSKPLERLPGLQGPAKDRAGDHRDSEDLSRQFLPGNENGLESAAQQYRALYLAGLLSLPRWFPCRQDRPGYPQCMQHVSSNHRPGRSAKTGDCEPARVEI